MHKRRPMEEETERRGYDLFDSLPDDLVFSILSRLGASARCPSDFISVLLTCRRLRQLGLSPQVLSKASSGTFSIRYEGWTDSARSFLKLCADSGNIAACKFITTDRLLTGIGERLRRVEQLKLICESDVSTFLLADDESNL